ncbi:hypothetical protein BCJMU07_0291 [Bacillus cereus]|nr:hypothetical protein BCJMU07_0291 [Bacillus cereus]
MKIIKSVTELFNLIQSDLLTAIIMLLILIFLVLFFTKNGDGFKLRIIGLLIMYCVL